MSELMEVEKATVLAAFSGKNGLESVIEETKLLIENFDHDMSTGASRKRTASLANKVSKLKVSLDGMGKDLVSGWKTQAKAVDINRKIMRDSLDELKVVARKPLTEWEDEQAAIEAERLAAEAAEKLHAEIGKCEELAGFMDADFDREAQAEIDRNAAELARLAEIQRQLDKAAIEDALEDARLQAESEAKAEAQKAELERQRLIKKAQVAREAKEQAERDKIAAQERAKVEAENAEKARIAAKEQAMRDAQIAADNAKKAEIERHKLEAARIERERIEREEDIKHASNIMRAAKESLMKHAGIDEETAKKVIIAIKNDEVENVSIQF